jgi:hypothetical protein
MRLNWLIFAVLAASFAFFSACERSDLITGAGENVVADMDHTLVDFRRGFATLTLDSAAVDSAFSLPAAADPASSTQAAAQMLIGINRDGDTLASHAQFRVDAFAALRGTPLYTSRDTLRGAYIYFRTADTLGVSGPIAVFPSDTITGLRPVDRGDKVLGTVDDDGDDITAPATDNRIGAFTLGDGLDSIPLPAAAAAQLFAARVSEDSTAYHTFAFSIVDFQEKLRRVNNPYIVIHIARGNGQAVRDSLNGFTRLTAFENTSDGRTLIPYSSQHTLRTAVFRVNVSSILNSLDSLGLTDSEGARCELINAVIAVKANRGIVSDDSDDEGASGLTTANIGSYRIVVLDTLITNEIPADSADVAALRSLRGQFGAVASTTAMLQNVHSIKSRLRSIVERPARERNARPYIYIYLRPTTESSVILWDRPPMVETIFTPSRSQY